MKFNKVLLVLAASSLLIGCSSGKGGKGGKSDAEEKFNEVTAEEWKAALEADEGCEAERNAYQTLGVSGSLTMDMTGTGSLTTFALNASYSVAWDEEGMFDGDIPEEVAAEIEKGEDQNLIMSYYFSLTLISTLGNLDVIYPNLDPSELDELEDEVTYKFGISSSSYSLYVSATETDDDGNQITMAEEVVWSKSAHVLTKLEVLEDEMSVSLACTWSK